LSCAGGISTGISSEITVFDSTGLVVQDAAVAQMIYKAAVKTKTGLKIKLF